jgi:uncharacterized protein YecE (DUF72 family)
MIIAGCSGWNYKHWKGRLYPDRYSSEELAEWREQFMSWKREGVKEIYCYFDNDDSAYAVNNAIELNKLIKETNDEAI